MRYIRLGRTDLQVSRVAFGTWAFGGDWGAFDEGEAKGAIHHALELGINLFDTGPGLRVREIRAPPRRNTVGASAPG